MQMKWTRHWQNINLRIKPFAQPSLQKAGFFIGYTMLRLLLFAFLTSLMSWTIGAQSLYFPPVNNATWDTLSPQVLNWCPERIDSLHAFLDGSNSKAFIVLKDGKIVMERYFDSFTADSIWYWASAGKTLAAFLVGLAQEQGHLAIEDPVSDYLGQGWTSMDDSLERQIRIRHQLSMTTGLDYTTGNLDCTDPACLHYKADPGTQWYYHNAPYTLTHDVVEAATGLSWNQYTFQQLAFRTGIQGLWFTNGFNQTYASTPRAMARFGLLMLANGVWEGDTILHDQLYFSDMVNTSNPINESYGYLWWLNGKSKVVVPGLPNVLPGPIIPEAPADMYAGLGKNDQKVYVIPSEQMVVIRMGNAYGPPALAPSSFDNLLWSYLSDMECNPAGVNGTVEADIKLYPNPAQGVVQVQSSHEIQYLHVFDLQGREVWRANDVGATVHIVVDEWTPGYYWVAIVTAKGTRQLPLAVQ